MRPSVPLATENYKEVVSEKEHELNEEYRKTEENKARAVEMKTQVQEVIFKIKAC